MHVGVDEARHDVAAGRVDDLRTVVIAEPRDVAVGDGYIGLQPLAREYREHASAPEDEVGALVAPGNRESAGEIGHGPTLNRIDPCREAHYASRHGRPHPAVARGGAAHARGLPERAADRGQYCSDGGAEFRPRATRRTPQPERG